jgi:tripartite-type tricarboxylate transporter receptor subunit TctC
MTIHATPWDSTLSHAGTAIVLAIAGIVAGSQDVFAQAPYPNRPIRLIVPYPPGAGTDFTGREIGQQFMKALGQAVVIDNRPGVAATLGHGLAAKAPPDGYTLLLGTTGGLVSGPALLGSRIPYDPLKDFETIGLATYVPYSLVLYGGLPANNVREFVELARASPRKLNFASPGVGTPNHLGGAQLMSLTGIELVHVPYKGSAISITDLISGQVQLSFMGLLQVLPLAKTGKLKIIGIGHPQRLKFAPDIPAIAETIPGFYNTGWWGIAAPAGTPKPIVEKLNAIMNKALATPEMIQRFAVNGLEVATSTPEGYREIIRDDLQMWRKLIKDANIKVDSLP